ncbi:GNAT family N-acetyltransferase [Ruegeria arenilitoris]|uniref:GNAT family N-acetyltransferase n=1 Tax=Ruegeria arenilitoris TaxID=1173585 RepID=UPI001C2B7D30|nr:GNAT family N-acetyltransferase [Ruegeria arenilitoris]
MDNLVFRKAVLDDAEGLSEVLQELTAAGKRSRPSNADFVRTNYIADPCGIQCTVAVLDGRLLGLQSLKRAIKGNAYDVPEGWGIIGTHIRPTAARLGIGRAMFQESLSAARAAGIKYIDATIGAENAEGLGYYQAMGFVDYRQSAGSVSKKYTL